MTQRSASAAVEVTVDPMSAFTAFTDEIDSWWVRGAINFFDAGRAVEMRIEPGVGGRVLEIYDGARGDVLELGRITVWEPGAQLTYRSLVDDTEVDVRFEAVEGGTRVSVNQTVLPGGERAFLFWPNVLRWLGSWCEEREPARREIARLSIALYYADPAAAARWLARVFQLGSWSGIPAEGEDPEWIELHHGNVAVLLFGLDDGQRLPDAAITHIPWAYVDDLDAHFAHAKAAGAKIVSEIEQHGYRAYTAEDLEGRRWTFAQARPTMA
ncbi:MAG: bleomycin resistance protein [Actinomycetota bacterium]|nr:bleomycin resistance protein [Actinomycetota bacterium]